MVQATLVEDRQKVDFERLAGRLLNHPVGRLIAGAVMLSAVLIAWQIASQSAGSALWISSPTRVFAVLSKWTLDGSLWLHLKATLLAMCTGYVVGSAAGIFAGIALGLLPRFERIVSPLIVALYCLPKISIAPLLVIFFGIGIESKIVLVAITVFFLILFSTLDGLKDIDHDLIDGLRLMGASEAEITYKVVLPGAMHWIMSGLRVSVRFAFTAAILGEIISSNRGLGFLIEYSAVKYDSSGVIAGMVVIVILSVIFTELLGYVERVLSPGRQATAASEEHNMFPQ